MSKTERIERLEQQVHELQKKLNEQLDAINMLHSDIVDLQQFKRFIELSSASRNRILSQNDAK
jgi:hypothetical protein